MPGPVLSTLDRSQELSDNPLLPHSAGLQVRKLKHHHTAGEGQGLEALQVHAPPAARGGSVLQLEDTVPLSAVARVKAHSIKSTV